MFSKKENCLYHTNGAKNIYKIAYNHIKNINYLLI